MWFEDIPLNEKATLGSYIFTEENILAFARAYDPQPFHVDKEAAARSPYGGLIASGWHTGAVGMRLMVGHRRAEAAAGKEEVQDNYVSPGVKDIRWWRPVRPGTTLIYSIEAFNKADWPSLPRFGLLQSRNQARDEQDVLYYSYISQVLILRRPTL